LQTEKEPLLQVILVGQPDLQERLRHPSLMQLAQRVSVQYHLTPLDQKETKEYIVYRLARAGGSGIFTDSALEKLFEYTKGVPRRLNTLCDLSMVAGFAEGRHDIDGEFLETVMAAQGIGLETLAPSEEPSPRPQPEYQKPADFRPLVSDDGLGLAVAELSSRLSRLESLMLELSGHLLPVLRQLLGKQAPPDTEKALTAESSAPPLTDDTVEAEQDLPTPSPYKPQVRRRWWARIWKR
jgi:general secretion pathway protein A